MKNFVRAFGLSTFVFASLNVAIAKAEPVSGVVELFTSQGCSSCPPADKVLGAFAKDKSVLALAWHVDYWDYIGWKDTFASADYTQRQRAYARAQKERMIYTPQAMVNGRQHMNGGAGGKVQAALASFRQNSETALSVPVDLVRDGENIRIKLDAMQHNANGNSYMMSLIRFQKTSTVKIERGENTGRSIEYHHIVREVRPMAMWEGKEIDMALPRDLVASLDDNSGLAVLVQAVVGDNEPGPIVGAAQLLN